MLQTTKTAVTTWSSYMHVPNNGAVSGTKMCMVTDSVRLATETRMHMTGTATARATELLSPRNCASCGMQV